MINRLRELHAEGHVCETFAIIRLSVDYASLARFTPDKVQTEEAWAVLWQLKDAVQALNDPELNRRIGAAESGVAMTPAQLRYFCDCVLQAIVSGSWTTT